MSSPTWDKLRPIAFGGALATFVWEMYVLAPPRFQISPLGPVLLLLFFGAGHRLFTRLIGPTRAALFARSRRPFPASVLVLDSIVATVWFTPWALGGMLASDVAGRVLQSLCYFIGGASGPLIFQFGRRPPPDASIT